MRVRLRWFLGFGLAAVFAGACSSSSSGGPAVVDAGDAGSGGGGAEDAAAPIVEAAPAAMCDAVSLAPSADAAAAACFECQAAQCVAEVAACSTDCVCAPAYGCLEQNSSAGALSSGYSQCPEAVNAVTDGNPALMALAGCASLMCHPQCFGGDGG